MTFQRTGYVAVILLVFVAACGSGETAGTEFPTGRFESTAENDHHFPLAIEFNEDGTFGFFTTPSSDVAMVEGTYSVEGSLYTDSTSDYSGCPFPGTYTWAYDGQDLTFQLFEAAECAVRRSAYDGQTYTRS